MIFRRPSIQIALAVALGLLVYALPRPEGTRFEITNDPGDGSGLGLPICHTIMKGLEGSITFESAPGEGTIFTVRPPRAGV